VAQVSVTVFLDADEITAESYSISCQRGRSLESETFDVGTATVTVRNYNANFNPYFLSDTSALLMESGDFLLQESGDRILLEFGNGTGEGTYGEILTGRKLTVKDGATTVFVGFVEDYDFTWTSDMVAEASLMCRDAMATIGATSLLEWLPTEGELTGERVASLLDRDEVSFPSGGGDRDIADGTQPLAGAWNTTVDGETVAVGSVVSFGTNPLAYLQTVTEAESGRLFVDRTGTLTFQDRYESFGVAASADFDDSDTNLPFHGIDVRFGTELLHFKVSVDRDGGTVQTATNAAQIAAYPTLGARHLTISGLPYQSDDHAAGLATFLLDRYSSIRAVVSGLTINLHALGTSDRATVAALDIGQVVTLTWTPPGTTGSVFQTLAIEGVAYRSDDSEFAAVTFQLSDASDPDYFQVDTDAVDGPKLVAP